MAAGESLGGDGQWPATALALMPVPFWHIALQIRKRYMWQSEWRRSVSSESEE